MTTVTGRKAQPMPWFFLVTCILLVMAAMRLFKVNMGDIGK